MDRATRVRNLNGHSDLYYLIKEDIEHAQNATALELREIRTELQKTNSTLNDMFLLGDRFLKFVEKTTPIVINFTKFLVIVIAVLIAGTTITKFLHG